MRPTRKPSRQNDDHFFYTNNKLTRKNEEEIIPLTLRISLLSAAIFFTSFKSDFHSKTVLTQVMAEKNLWAIKRLVLKDAIWLEEL